MVKRNKLGTDNKWLKGREWTDMDVKKSTEIVDKINKTLKRIDQLRMLEEYVGGRPKTVNPRTFKYQVDSNVSYYVIPHGRLLTELTQENHVPKVIALNEPDIPLTEDNEGPPYLINTEGTHEQNVQNKQITTQPTKGPLGNNMEILVSINKYLVPDVPHSYISNQASTRSHPAP
nr:hypothetical protein [Tanacetum cinerariifolium]